MKIGCKEKINDSIKSDKDFLDKEKEKNNINEPSKLDDKKDPKDDRLNIDDKDNKVIQEIHNEKKESKWDKIDWSKDVSEEKKESKWDKIDWSKDVSEEKKESNWYKEYSENEKIKGYINENLEDNIMFNEDNDEKVEDLKDFNESIEYKDIDEEFIEVIGDKLDEHKFEKDFIEGIEDELDKSHIKKEFRQKDDERDFINDFEEDIKDNIGYKNLTNDKLQEKFKEYYNETEKYANWGIKIKKDFIYWLDEKIEKEDISIREKDNLDKLKYSCMDINKNQEIKEFIIEKIRNSSLTQQQISKESEKIGINLSSATISRIYQELSKKKNLFEKANGPF